MRLDCNRHKCKTLQVFYMSYELCSSVSRRAIVYFSCSFDPPLSEARPSTTIGICPRLSAAMISQELWVELRLTRALGIFSNGITLSMDVMQTTKKACRRILESFPNLPAEPRLLAAIVLKRRQNATRSFPVVDAKGGIFDASYVLLVEPRKT